MKKILFILMVGLFVSTKASNELTTAIKELDIHRVKEILKDKAHAINKKELKHYLMDLKESMQFPVADVPWYERYGTLTKIGIGAIGTGLTAHFLHNAITQNPEPGVSFFDLIERFFKAQPSMNQFDRTASNSVHAPLCVTSGIVGAVSLHTVITGIRDLNDHTSRVKRRLIRALIKEAFKAMQ